MEIDHHPIPPIKLAAVILAGGQARRMGGEDKGLISYRGTPLIEQVLQRLKPQYEQIIISANRNRERYASYGYPVVADLNSDFAGPLAGMLSALHNNRESAILTLPCDTPFIASDYVARMVSAQQADPERACVAQYQGEIEPLFVLLPAQSQMSLAEYLQRGQRKAREWLASLNPIEVDFSDRPEMFKNFNSRKDLDDGPTTAEEQR